MTNILSVSAQAIQAGGFQPTATIEEVTLKPDEALTVYIEATRIRDELDSKLKELGRLTATLEPVIIDYFKEKGQQRVTRNGRTVYLAREIWPKVVDDDLTQGASGDSAIAEAQERARARLIEALSNDPETKHLVKAAYNHQTLRSFLLNDCPEGEDGLPQVPEHLRGKLGVTEVFKAKVLKS